MRLLARIAVIVLLAHLALILWTNRALFLSKFDEVYWKDKYEQSQWKLPLSVRTLGDDGLYLYEGYRLAHGADPTLLNAEVPPLGKYIIGATVRGFDNGHIYGLLVYAGVLAIFYLLALTLLPAPVAIVATVLLALDPLLTSQATITMLDSLQLLFLLLFFLLLTKRAHPAFLGIVIGLFAETKFGILAPLLIAVAAVSLWPKWRHILVLLVCAAGAYALPYVYYFALGHSILDWMRVQKWIVSFYLSSNLTPTVGSAAVTLMGGYVQNIFSRGWVEVGEWSPLWPAVTLAAIGMFLRDGRWRYLGLFVAATFVFYMLIPFWTRYLLLLLPFLYLAGAAAIAKLSPKIAVPVFAVFLLLNAGSSLRIIFPTPEGTVQQFAYEWQHGFFQDMYENLAIDKKSAVTRDDFRKIGLTAYHDAQIEAAQITIENPVWSRIRQTQTIPLTITYFTRSLGAFTAHVSMPIVREDGRWRIPWEWSMLLPDLNEKTRIQTTIIPARRGSILGSDKKPLAEDVPGVLVWVTPGQIEKSQEEELLSLLETVFDGKLPKVAVHQRIFGNTLSQVPVPVGVIPHVKTDPNVMTIATYPGVTFTQSFTRLYHPNNIVELGKLTNTAYTECCSYLYQTTNYDGISGVELTKNNKLKGVHGGTLTLVDANGTLLQTFISRGKQDGENVEP